MNIDGLHKVFGCSDDSACNYDKNTTLSDESCWYPEDEGWCDCDGNLIGDDACAELVIVNQPIPQNIIISNIYPNPFNPFVNINYELSYPDVIATKVYNVNGKLIETIMSDYKLPGKHTLTWNASWNPSGIYFLSITNGSEYFTKKIILI